MAIKVSLHGAGESRVITVNQHTIPAGSRERTWAKVATAIASEVRTHEPVTSPHDATAAVVAATVNPEPTTDLNVSPAVTAVEAPGPTTTDLTALLEEVDAIMNPQPKPERKPTVQEIERKRGLQRLNEKVVSERDQYAEKSQTAIEIAKKLGVL